MDSTILTNRIGERIKALRTEQRMTLAELGEKTNLSISYLSQIERDKTTPSLSTLTSIAKTLNVGLRHFFETDAEAAFVVRKGGVLESLAGDFSIAHLPLSLEAENNKLAIHRLTIQPHTPPEQLVPYPGEELVYVLSGELTIAVGEEEFTLSAGDSVHYDALQPHSWSNRGDECCVAIWSHSTTRTERSS